MTDKQRNDLFIAHWRTMPLAPFGQALDDFNEKHAMHLDVRKGRINWQVFNVTLGHLSGIDYGTRRQAILDATRLAGRHGKVTVEGK